MWRRISLAIGLVCLTACEKKAPPDFAQMKEEAVYSLLSLSPVSAAATGLHRYNDVSLDEQLDDYSTQGLEKSRQLTAQWKTKLSAVDRTLLDAQDKADLEILLDAIAGSEVEDKVIQSYKHNPTIYVELVGNALFTPLSVEYAPKPERMRHIMARVEKIPALMEAAKKNLTDAPEVWNRVAREENEGNIALVDKTIRAAIPDEQKPDYEKRAATALAALRGFNEWLEKDLSKRTSDWRLGKEKYAQKFKYALGIEQSPEELLKIAEKELEAVRKEMFGIASTLQKGNAGSDVNKVVSKALNQIAQKHSTIENYFADARRDLEEARNFVREKKLMALPPRDNLKVIETPEFMRGIYAVGGFNQAPPLEPQLGAFYWLTPIPGTWPKERIESKLREYNYYGLKLLTVHEAMPGHYLQAEYANDIQPTGRRVVRAVFGNGPCVEGYAVYATAMMIEEGYLDHSPELRLVFLKQQLRMIANTILDVRMQTMNMTDAEAMHLMLDQTFQEKEEATAKLQRTQLSSAQLPYYFAGFQEWMRIRQQVKQRYGTSFQLSAFHEKALKIGAVPMRVLGKLMAE